MWTCSETTLLVFPRGGSNEEEWRIEKERNGEKNGDKVMEDLKRLEKDQTVSS